MNQEIIRAKSIIAELKFNNEIVRQLKVGRKFNNAVFAVSMMEEEPPKPPPNEDEPNPPIEEPPTKDPPIKEPPPKND
jgi:hypothetical protein